MILANRHHIWLFAAAYTAGILLAGQMPQHQILPAILILAGIGAVCYLHPAKKECVILALLLSGAVLSGFGLTRHQAMQYTKTGFTGRTAHGNIGSYQWNPDTKRTKI